MNKTVKILAGCLAFFLIGGLLWLANGFVGNPVSRIMAKQCAQQYIAEQYPDHALEIERVSFSFKCGHYYAHVFSPDSRDTHFSLSISPLGELQYDSYNHDVRNKWNTFMRIDQAYRKAAESIFDSEDFPYPSWISYAEIANAGKREVAEASFFTQYGIRAADLTLDQDFDLEAIGKTAGHIVFYTEDEDVSIERAAEILLGIREELDKNHITFYAIDFELREALPEDEKPDPNREAIRVREFLYEDIVPEGMEARIGDAHAALQDYYDKKDAERTQVEASEISK